MMRTSTKVFSGRIIPSTTWLNVTKVIKQQNNQCFSEKAAQSTIVDFPSFSLAVFNQHWLVTTPCYCLRTVLSSTSPRRESLLQSSFLLPDQLIINITLGKTFNDSSLNSILSDTSF